MDHQIVLGILYFLIYSFFGWIAQGIYCGFKKHRFVNTGFMYGPVVPIYGFGALLTIYLVDPISRNPLAVFLLTFLFCSVLEYFTSWAMQKLFHRLWWNYSKRPFNIHGRVCLLNSTLYGVGGLVITFGTQPWISRWVSMISQRIQTILAIVLLMAFITDLGFTLYHMARIDGLIQKIHHAVVEHRLAELEDLSGMLDRIQADRHLKIFEDSRLHESVQESLNHAKQHLIKALTR